MLTVPLRLDGWQIAHAVPLLCFLRAELEGLVEPTPAADWWSLGAILFEILTGKVIGLYFTLSYWLDLISKLSSALLISS